MPKAPSALKAEKKETAKRPAKKDSGEKKDKKPLSPYMAFMKEKLAEYKDKHPTAPHKEAFSAVAASWAESDQNPNKGKEKKVRAPKVDKPRAVPTKKSTRGKRGAKSEDESAGDNEDEEMDEDPLLEEEKPASKSKKPTSKVKKTKKDDEENEE